MTPATTIRKQPRTRQHWMHIVGAPMLLLLGYGLGLLCGWPLAGAWIGAACGLGLVVALTPDNRTPLLNESDLGPLQAELEILASANELHRMVSEINAELVGCSDDYDAKSRFASALGCYWKFDQLDLMV